MQNSNKRPSKYHPFGTDGNLPPLDISKYINSGEKLLIFSFFENNFILEHCQIFHGPFIIRKKMRMMVMFYFLLVSSSYFLILSWRILQSVASIFWEIFKKQHSSIYQRSIQFIFLKRLKEHIFFWKDEKMDLVDEYLNAELAKKSNFFFLYSRIYK